MSRQPRARTCILSRWVFKRETPCVVFFSSRIKTDPSVSSLEKHLAEMNRSVCRSRSLLTSSRSFRNSSESWRFLDVRILPGVARGLPGITFDHLWPVWFHSPSVWSRLFNVWCRLLLGGGKTPFGTDFWPTGIVCCPWMFYLEPFSEHLWPIWSSVLSVCKPTRAISQLLGGPCGVSIWCWRCCACYAILAL